MWVPGLQVPTGKAYTDERHFLFLILSGKIYAGAMQILMINNKVLAALMLKQTWLL
jgi:hypothetical protein